MTDKSIVPPPAYFLSLSLENVRSFGEKQTISFARPDGRPAQWTIILGDNGVGKTTVLKALAALRPIPSANLPEAYEAAFSFKGYYDWKPKRSNNENETVLSYSARPWFRLTDKSDAPKTPIINHIHIGPSIEHQGKLGLKCLFKINQ